MARRKSELQATMKETMGQCANEKQLRDKAAADLQDRVDRVSATEKRVSGMMKQQEDQNAATQESLHASLQDVLDTTLKPLTSQLTESERRHSKEISKAEMDLAHVRREFESEMRCLRDVEQEIIHTKTRMQDVVQNKISDAMDTIKFEATRDQEARSREVEVARRLQDAQSRMERDLHGAILKADDADRHLRDMENVQNRLLREQERLAADMRQASEAEMQLQEE